MKLGLLVFGQFRAWEDVLEQNLTALQKEFQQFDVDVFILTDKLKSGMYSTVSEERIKQLIIQKGFHLHSLFYWEDQEHLHEFSSLLHKLNQDFLGSTPPSWKNDWMMNLWYRRYVLWTLVKEAVNISDYSVFFFARIFDTSIEIHSSLQQYLTDLNTLHVSLDTLFFGSPKLMDILLKFGSSPKNWKQTIDWTQGFKDTFLTFDSHIAGSEHTLCSGTQIFKYIYDTIPLYKNLRNDFNKGAKDLPLSVRIVRHMNIPRHIFQIALGDAYVSSLPIELVKKNLVDPNAGFSYRLLLLKDCLEFLSTHFPQYIPLFHSLQRPQYKSDLIRYLWLYTYGGWYIDIDLLPLVPLRKLYEITEQADTIVSFGANHTFEMANGFLASVPGQEIFLNLVEQMAAHPNPSDFGMNVKRMFKTCKELFSIEPFQKRNGVFSLLEQQLQPGRYFICYGNQPVVVSNGNEYPPKA